MNRLSLSKGIFISLLVIFDTLAATAEVLKPTSENAPKIGLVLSGGGAKGAAHIGVLKVLEQLNVPIDYIAGTSMGSVIGGLYAAGFTPEEIEQQIRRIDWDAVFIDEPVRAARSMQRKREDANLLAKTKPRVKEGKINLAPALIQGQKLGLELRKLTLPVAHIQDFDQLSIPFRAVATDAMTGKAVVLKQGDLAQAIRASMAVPMIFAPVEYDGKILIDGGVASNTPISVAREMGADIVIVVMLDSKPLSKEQLNSPLVMATQLTNLLTVPGIEVELATLTEQDIMISVDLRDITPSDFDKMIQAIPLGLEAAQAQAKALQTLATPRKKISRSHLSMTQPPVIEFIELDNDSSLNDEVLLTRLSQKIGEPIDFTQLEADISRIYSTDIFATVDYELLEKNGRQGLRVKTQERPWGTSFIQGGLQLSADLNGDSFFNVGIAYTQQPLNGLNGEWRTAIQLGEEPQFVTELYQPLDAADHWFASIQALRQTIKIKLFENDQAISEYRGRGNGARLSLGRNFGEWGRLSATVERIAGTADLMVGDTQNPNFDFDIGNFSLYFQVDTVDSLTFPRDGQVASLTTRWSHKYLGAEQNFEQLELLFVEFHSWGAHTLSAGADYQTSLDNTVPIQSRYRSGGFLRLSGLQENQISGEESALLRLGYQYRLSAKILPTYLGLSLEAGNAWDEEADWQDLNSSLSLYFGADTLLGPVYLGYGLHEWQKQSFYLFLGQPWF